MQGLERRLGLASAIAISLGASVGAVFVVPGLAASITGPSMGLAFFIAGICVLPAALSKAELATAMPTVAYGPNRAAVETRETLQTVGATVGTARPLGHPNGS